MSPKVIILTGAPTWLSLTAASPTVQHFDEDFHEILDIKIHKVPQVSPPPPASSSPLAVWRSIPLARQQLHFSQVHAPLDTSFQAARQHFFTTVDLTGPTSSNYSTEFTKKYEPSDSNEEQLLSQFCEQSLAAHHTIPSSQLESFEQTMLLDDETSFLTTTSTSIDAPVPAPPAVPSHLSDVEDVPSAAQLMSLHPQTVTLNLIVGILSIAQPRAITTRWGQELSLVEVLVGDDTKTGFGVTFWLPNNSVPQSDVGQLRRQDVVLMQNVALHVFRNKVYGQSLRRGLTKLDLLWRRDGSGHYQMRDLKRAATLQQPQLDKTKQVVDWVIHFVGVNVEAKSKSKRDVWDNPPNDTQ